MTDRQASNKLAQVMYYICEKNGFGSDLLATLGSWGDTVDDEEILQQLEGLRDDFKPLSPKEE